MRIFSTYAKHNYITLILCFVALIGLVGSGLSSASGSKDDSTRLRATDNSRGLLNLTPGNGPNNSVTNATAGRGARHADLVRKFLRPASQLAPTAAVLTATKTDNLAQATQVDPGGTIMYTVEITNTGDANATNVNFTDTIDANTTLVPGSVVVAPIAVNDAYNTIGNVNIQVPAPGVMGNDLNPNGSGTLSVTLVNATPVPGTAATTNGSVTMASDGSFTYTPNAGFSGPTDTFTYTLGNSATPGKTDTATVTITVSGRIWFVNSGAGVNGDGRLNTPFNILTGAGSADSVDAANDVVFLYSSGTNYTGGITLNSGEKIIGQGASQSILTITGFTAPSGTNLLPGTAGADPVITTAGTTAITLGTGNGLHGFTVGNTGAAGTDISGTSFGTLTVRDVTVNGTGRALNLATGTMAAGSTFDLIESNGGSPAEGVRLNTVGGSFTSPTTNVVNPTGTGIDVQSSPAGTSFSFGGTTVNKGASAGTGVNLNSNAGTFSFSSLAVTTSNGTGVSATSSGTVNVTTGSISSNGNSNASPAPALLVNPTAINMTYTSVSSTNSSTTGISLTSASGSLSIGTTTITNPTGVGISATSCSATLNFGTTTVNNSGGTGVVLGTSGNGNTGAVTFGDLDIDPDNNVRCLHAVDNTMTITATSGTINATGATAVEITRTSSTTPLALGFTRVDSSAATSGIVLTNTSGSFTVTGNGADATLGGNGTGGTITGMTGPGVNLSNVSNTSITSMMIVSGSDDGIRGLNTTGFTVNRSSVLNNGNAVTERGLEMTNLLGTCSITNSLVTGNAEDNLYVKNGTGTLNLTTSATTYANTSASVGNDGIHFLGADVSGSNNANMSINVSNCIFTNNRGDHFQAVTDAVSAATQTIVFQNNDLNNTVGTNLGAGLTLNPGGTANVSFNISNNGTAGDPFSGAFVSAITINSSNNSTMSGTINNNIIGNAAVTDSGSFSGDGITVFANNTSDITVAITNNTIRQYSNLAGINIHVRDGASDTINATITGNTISNPGTFASNGILAQAGSVAGDTGFLCLDIGGAGALANSIAGSGANGGDDFRVRQRILTTVRLPGYVGANNGDAAVVAFIQGRNNGAETGSATNNVAGGGGGFVGGAACSAAANPMSVDLEVTASSAQPVTDDQPAIVENTDKGTLRTAPGEGPYDDNLQKLKQEELNWMVQAAIARWAETGISAEDLARMQGAAFEVTDLPNSELAALAGDQIKIDETAAGYGWYFDQFPTEESEFQVLVPGKELQTTDLSTAHGKMDLLTVVMHELGKVYLQGKDKLPMRVWRNLESLMEPTLSPGVRRLPELDKARIAHSSNSAPRQSPAANVAAMSPSQTKVDSATSQPSLSGLKPALFNPSGDLMPGNYGRSARRISFTPNPSVVQGKGGPSSGETINLNLGTIPPGEKAVIMFSVTVSDPFTGATAQVCNQGTVTADGGINITTTDPGPPVVNGPTCTQINLPDVTVAVAPSSTPEDGVGNLVYTFSRTGPTTSAITVNFSVGGTATPPGGATPDYTQTGAATFTTTTGTVTIPVGQASADVTIDPTTDTAFEPDETVILTVTTGIGYDVGAPAAATGTITNDDTEVSVAVSPTSTPEDGATNLVYTFTRQGITTGALTVNFTIGGTATPPGGATPDYSQTGAATFTPPNGTVTFAAGSSTATVTIDPTVDTTVEPDETVILTVTAGTGYTVGTPSVATGTIANDDADVSVAVAPASVQEDGATNLVYTFTRTGFTGAALTINITVGGTAVFVAGPGSDYTQTGAATFTPTTGTVTFTGTNTTATVTIDPTADAAGEADETVSLTVVSGTGYNAAPPTSATGTILNDDTAVSVVASPTSSAEDTGPNMVYTFTRTGDTSTALLVNFSVGGTATPPGGATPDYTQTGADTFTTMTGTITIPVGQASAAVTIDPTTDITVESDETVILTVTAGSGYNPGPPNPATGTILNDDTDVSVTVVPASVLENSGTSLVFTFTRTGVTTGALTANFTISGSATFTTDYTQAGAASFTPPTGTVSFGAGVAMVAVTVTPVPDTDVEPDETVVLAVAAGTGYNIAPVNNTATGTITNDDTDVTLSVSPASVGEDGATPLVYTFTRGGVTMGALTVNYTIAGTATFTNDYTQTGAASFAPPNGSVIIADGNTTATVTLTPVNDVKVEGAETVSLTLSASPNYDIGTPGAVTGTIVDNDTATTALALSSSNAPEQTTPHNVGVTLVITANGAGTPMLERLVTVNVQDLLTGTAAGGGTDYTLTNPTTVSFNIGDIAQTKNVSIAVVNDLFSEGNETINLALNTLVDGTGGQVSIVAPTSHTVTIVDNDIDLKVTKAESADPVAAGSGTGNLTYTITLMNIGLTNATGVVLSEVLTIPAGVTVDSVTSATGAVVMNTATNYTWNVGDLAVKGSATLTAVLTVGPAAMTGTNSICDTATITTSNEVRVNTTDDAVTECTSIVAQADLEIVSKTDTPDPVCVDGTITYTVSLRNNGPGPGLNTSMTDVVPANTTFVSASVTSGAGWTTSTPPVGGTGNIVFSKASVANGETAVFQIVVRVNIGTAGGATIMNTATASSTLIDPLPVNNSKTAATTVDPIAPVITCPANITVSTDPNQCAAVVNYPAPTVADNCPCNVGAMGTKAKTGLGFCVPVCNPPAGSTFAKGTTTVTCTTSDAAGNTASCSFTVTVNDTQPPAITCPADITTKTPSAGNPCVIVNYPPPVATDNCPDVTVVCVPPSGSCFPLGTTTVTCTATDATGNTATCTFKVTIFDLCLQDDSNPSTSVLINSTTGDYRFCCNGVTYTGRGTMTIRGSIYTLQHNPSDRRVLVRVDESVHKGTGSIQAPPGTTRCTITESNTQNNSCVCQ